MKRAIGLIVAVIACIVAFLSIRGTMPFMPIFGSSMEPALQSGGLLMIEPVDPKDVKVGDIIVYNVAPMVRDYYNYPPTVAHRVIEVKTSPSFGFRTKGDNTGEDPFTVRPQDLRGTVGSQIPFIGLPLLFFQSTQGLIFVIIALIILAFFLYGNEISLGGSWLHRGIFAPVINEERRSSHALTQKMEATEQRMNSTEQALEKFAAAVAEYAQHLASHTSAIQGLSEASHELKRGAAEQNRVLAALMENLGKPEQLEKLADLEAETAAPEPEKPAPKAKKPVEEKAKPVKFHGIPKQSSPPGCARKRPATSEEVMEMLKKSLD